MPSREELSLVLAEFQIRLSRGLEVSLRCQPYAQRADPTAYCYR